MKKLPRPGKPKTLKSPAVKHKRSPIKGSRPATGSSTVASTNYNPETGHLDVTFHGGRSYQYSGVSEETAAGIESAKSVGGYLHSAVIGKHDVTKI